MRITTNAYDGELTDLIAAGKADLTLAGVKNVDDSDALVKRAVITYCRANFGSPADYDRLKAAYDEQKAQLISATGYGLEDENV